MFFVDNQPGPLPLEVTVRQEGLNRVTVRRLNDGRPRDLSGRLALISGRVERLAARIARVQVVPEGDPVLLALDPAQVHLAAVL